MVLLSAVLGRESVANVPADRAAMGSGSNNTARYLGAACGITVFSVVLSHAGTGVGAAGWWTDGPPRSSWRARSRSSARS
jgi:hypothetical protein